MPAFSGLLTDTAKRFGIMANNVGHKNLRKQSCRTHWDDIGRFRPFGVPVLFPSGRQQKTLSPAVGRREAYVRDADCSLIWLPWVGVLQDLRPDPRGSMTTRTALRDRASSRRDKQMRMIASFIIHCLDWQAARSLGHLPEVAVSSNTHRLPRFVNARRRCASNSALTMPSSALVRDDG